MQGDALEDAVKRAMHKLLDSLGERCWYTMPVRTRWGKQQLDFEGSLDGHFFAIETKREGGGKCSAAQARTIEAIRQAGGVAWIENSRGLEETKVVLEHHFGILVPPTVSSERSPFPPRSSTSNSSTAGTGSPLAPSETSPISAPSGRKSHSRRGMTGPSESPGKPMPTRKR